MEDKCKDCNNVKGCITCIDGSEWAHYEESVSEDLEKAVQAYSNLYNDECFDAIGNECPHIKNAFKAGAEWLAGQGETLYDTINVDGKNQRWLGENLLYGDYNAGQAVIVQIRKL